MWLWVGFNLVVLILLSVDLRVTRRNQIRRSTALVLSLIWIGLALAFNGFIYGYFGAEKGVEFFTAYLVEKSLSVDNLFIFMVIFSSFQVPANLQYRVLYLGVIGAFVLRLVLILGGVYLISLFHWLTYVLGVVVAISGYKLFVQKKVEVNLKTHWLLRWVRSHYPITDGYEGERFTLMKNGVKYLTPLLLVLLLVELSDVVFALDSIPAVFAVTHDPFIAYSSNVFAVLGLRSLYFLLAPSIDLFTHFKKGLGLILGFIGFKMLTQSIFDISIGFSLTVVSLLIGGSILVSLLRRKK